MVDIWWVLMLIDAHGNPMRRRQVTTLNEGWLTVIDPIDISSFNKDWFRVTK